MPQFSITLDSDSKTFKVFIDGQETTNVDSASIGSYRSPKYCCDEKDEKDDTEEMHYYACLSFKSGDSRVTYDYSFKDGGDLIYSETENGFHKEIAKLRERIMAKVKLNTVFNKYFNNKDKKKDKK